MQSPENRFRPIEDLVIQYKAINKDIGPVRAAIEYIKEKNPFAFEILKTLVWLNPFQIQFQNVLLKLTNIDNHISIYLAVNDLETASLISITGPRGS